MTDHVKGKVELVSIGCERIQERYLMFNHRTNSTAAVVIRTPSLLELFAAGIYVFLSTHISRDFVVDIYNSFTTSHYYME